MVRRSLSRWERGFILLFMVGFSRCVVAQSTSPRIDGKGVRLHAVIVQVQGDVSQSDVRALIPLHKGEAVDSARVTAARDTLTQRLGNLAGYPFAAIDEWVLKTRSSKSADLIISVNAGPLAVVDSLRVTGVPSAYLPEIQPLIRTSIGEPFNPSLWAGDLERTHDYLLENGHPFAKVISAPLTICDRGDTVGVIAGVEVVPGRRVTLDHVEVVGLKRTDQRLAARIAQLPRGSFYRPEILQATRRRLLATGWFRDVSEGELLRNSDGSYGILYRVEEGSAGSVSGVVGYAQQGDVGLSGALDVSLINLLGTGQSVELSWRRDSPKWFSFYVAYGKPFLFGSPLALRLELSQEAAESSWVARDATVQLGVELGTGWRVSGAVTGREVNADSFAVGLDSLDYSLVSLNAAVEYDSRDRPWNPSTGGYYRAGGERGWNVGSGDLSGINRTTLDVEQSVPVGVGWVGFAGLHGVEVMSDNGTPPMAEWVRFGGASSLRGYSERSLIAPRAGWLNLEFRRLLGGDNRVFALFDVGVLDGTGNRRQWKSSWGLGVQTGVGIGALQVAVAVPSREGFSAATVHLIARTTF